MIAEDEFVNCGCNHPSCNACARYRKGPGRTKIEQIRWHAVRGVSIAPDVVLWLLQELDARNATVVKLIDQNARLKARIERWINED